MSFPTLETPRLRLRELTLDDAPSLNRLGTRTFNGTNLGGTVVWVWGH